MLMPLKPKSSQATSGPTPKPLAPAKKYFITMFLISCLLLAVFTLVIYQQSKANEESTKWVIHSYEVMRNTRAMIINMYDADAAIRNYTNNSSSESLKAYQDAITKLDEKLKALEELTPDNPQQHENAIELQQNIAHFDEISGAEIELLRKHNFTATALQADSEARAQIIQDTREKIGKFGRAEMDLLNARVKASRAQQRNYMRTLFIGAILDLGAFVIANIVIFGLITRGSEVEEELRKSEERFRFLMHGINDGIFDRNLVDNTVYFSPAAKAMLGFSDNEIPNTAEAIDGLIHPDDIAGVWEAVQRYADHESPSYSSLFRMRHKNGDWHWILSRGVGIWDQSGKMLRLVGAHTDVTSQKLREEELKQLNADLEGFTYIASHDLRAPLVNLKGFSMEMQRSLTEAKDVLDRVKTRLPDTERQTLDQALDKDIPEAIGFIQSSVEKMDKLTSAILDLSRIGRREFHLQPVDTGVLVKRCLNALAYEIGAQKVNIECGELPTVISDAVALEQIFGNILDNAVKYLDQHRTGRIEIDAITLTTEIIFSIRDNGRGIGPGDENKVFDIFRRAGNTGNIRGAGMGMAYVKATLRKLSGRIWFQSVPGVGTVFYVGLPTRNIQSEAA